MYFHPCPTDLLCSEDDIIGLLLTLDTTKATGLDGISATMLKKTAAAAVPLLAHLCNMSIINGTVPEHWKTSMVVPIYKRGDTSNPENYWPMSLLPIISKILERYIFEKLCTFLYISDNQWGVQAGKSSTGAVLSAVHD